MESNVSTMLAVKMAVYLKFEIKVSEFDSQRKKRRNSWDYEDGLVMVLCVCFCN